MVNTGTLDENRIGIDVTRSKLSGLYPGDLPDALAQDLTSVKGKA